MKINNRSKPKIAVERRRFLRLPMAADIYFKALDEIIDTTGLVPSRACNLSPGGLLFYSPFRMKLGTIIQLMLVLKHRGRKRRIPALAKVVYCQPLSPERYELGAGFVSIFPRDLNFLLSLSRRSESRAPRPKK